MTRKDYELIAQVLRAQRKPHNDTDTMLNVANEFADALGETNPRFDRARFIEACEPRA